MPRVHPHYAVKANPNPAVLRTLIDEGVGFEIASIAELDLLLSLGVPAAEIYYSNPVKSRQYLRYAAAQGRASGTCWTASRSCARSSRSSPTPRLYLRIDVAQRGQRLAVVGQVRRPAEGGGGDHRRCGGARRPTWPA